jgi:hypothetical protein
MKSGQEIDWRCLCFFSFLHISAFYGVFQLVQAKYQTLIFGKLFSKLLNRADTQYHYDCPVTISSSAA